MNTIKCRSLWILGCVALAFNLPTPAMVESPTNSSASVKVGSKSFTENVILGEITTLMLKEAGAPAQHVRELGGTRILWNALLAGEIDAYPEYSGTLTHEILANQGIDTFDQLTKALAAKGLAIAGPIGFNNTYAIGITKKRASELGIEKISDLVKFPDLTLGFSNEFMDRAEGWPGLRDRYHLPQKNVRGMDHDLAYRGIESSAVDAMDLYSTDAEIAHYNLLALNDDLHFFPTYDALIIYRQDLVSRFPDAKAYLNRLAGSINEATMVGMNAQAKLKKVPESLVASEFVNQQFNLNTAVILKSNFTRLKRYTLDHCKLVFFSLFAAIIFSIPLGIAAAKFPGLGSVILSIVGIVQTIPSLALLVFMIPLVGIGSGPAMLALFLYSLLPIVRNTHQGLTGISPALRDSAIALGLPWQARLLRIELPLASGSILAGIKTSAVINIGTATLGALVGAGGYGQPILTGIRLDDVGLILMGAVPAAILALAAQWSFEFLERHWLPKGLRANS